ncbi:hypothetical protein Hanom_Chr11g00993901 [Helianthus anomalus]
MLRKRNLRLRNRSQPSLRQNKLGNQKHPNLCQNRFGNQRLIHQSQNKLGYQRHPSLNQNKSRNLKLICQNETFKMIQDFTNRMFQKDKFGWSTNKILLLTRNGKSIQPRRCSRCQQKVNKSSRAAWHRRRIPVVKFREWLFVNNNK